MIVDSTLTAQMIGKGAAVERPPLGKNQRLKKIVADLVGSDPKLLRKIIKAECWNQLESSLLPAPRLFRPLPAIQDKLLSPNCAKRI